jgi:hypothetical protein
MMDLAVCVVTPAFAGLRITKLLAMIAISQPVAKRYEARYGEPLLAVTTTCARGLHCACFNRIMLRPGGLYRKIGTTAGYTTSHFSNQTIKAARDFVLDGDGRSADVLRGKALALPVLRTAMKRLRLPHEDLLKLGLRKAVYFAETFPGARIALEYGESSESGKCFELDEIVTFWRTRLLKATSPPDGHRLAVRGSNDCD